MLAAVVLICSATLHDCTLDNATAVIRLPAEFGVPADVLHAQEALAHTSISRALGMDDRVKITCLRASDIRRAGDDTDKASSGVSPEYGNRDAPRYVRVGFPLDHV